MFMLRYTKSGSSVSSSLAPSLGRINLHADKIPHGLPFSKEFPNKQKRYWFDTPNYYQRLQLSSSPSTLGGGSTDKALLHAILRMVSGDPNASQTTTIRVTCFFKGAQEWLDRVHLVKETDELRIFVFERWLTAIRVPITRLCFCCNS
ncbi:hypothetical protein OIU84_021522 [Salix udensis]|uniref:Uncharacterized protein n=1 Tax=Salix udensis TaxID=889485 RepID=A0AAD6KUR8_9ROSI|nr:hypothetical protein OIU84_021522 [Salix udensis]